MKERFVFKPFSRDFDVSLVTKKARLTWHSINDILFVVLSRKVHRQALDLLLVSKNLLKVHIYLNLAYILPYPVWLPKRMNPLVIPRRY